MGNDRYKHLTDDERQTPDLLLLRAALDAARADVDRVRGQAERIEGERFKLGNRAADLRYQLAAAEARIGELREVLLELADLMDATAAGEYKPDSFSSQLARAILATPPQAAGEDDTCECGASDWLVTATMIECNQCKRLWGRCNGIWVPDMTTWPAVEAMEGQHYPGGEYVTTGGGCPTCKGTHMVSGTHGLDACPVCRPAEPTAGGEECSRCNAPLEQFPNSDTWYCSAGCSGMKELAPAKPGEGGA